MAVLLYHCNDSIPSLLGGHGAIGSATWGPFDFLMDGRNAVALFFVLSGYVLSLPWAQQRRRLSAGDLLGYVVGRIVRIYPVFVVATLGCLISIWSWSTPQDFATGYPGWHLRFQAEQEGINAWILQGLIMVPGVEFTVDPPGWSLAYEMWCSLLLPIVILPMVLRGSTLPMMAIACVVTTGLAFLFGNLMLFHFTLGALVAFCQSWGLTVLSKYRMKVVWLLVGVLLYVVSGYVGQELREMNISRWRDAHSLVAGVGAAMVILGSLGLPGVQNAILNPITRWAGSISYPLYVIHFAWIYGFGAWLVREANLNQAWMVWTLMLSGSWLLAELITRTVDQPSVQWSRRSNRWVRLRMSALSPDVGVVR